jgi:hypothetical protein
MQLTIKYSESSPIGAAVQRRVLKTVGFREITPTPLNSLGWEVGPLRLSDSELLVVKEASYTPANRIASIIIAYRTGEKEENIFAAVFELHNVPIHFAFKLPNGRFVEIYINLKSNK